MIDSQDVEATLMKQIQDNYSETPVEWPGVPFDEGGNPEYVQPYILTGTGTPVRDNCDFDTSDFYINVYAKLSSNGQRVKAITDIIKALFHRTDLALLSGDGMIRLQETDAMELPIEEVSDRRQMNLRFMVQVIQS